MLSKMMRNEPHFPLEIFPYVYQPNNYYKTITSADIISSH